MWCFHNCSPGRLPNFLRSQRKGICSVHPNRKPRYFKMWWASDLHSVLEYAKENSAGNKTGRKSLPIMLLVELKELTGSVRRKKPVIHVQSCLEGDECRVMLERGTSTKAIRRRGDTVHQAAVYTADYKCVLVHKQCTYSWVHNEFESAPLLYSLREIPQDGIQQDPWRITTMSTVQINFSHIPRQSFWPYWASCLGPVIIFVPLAHMC